MHETTDKLLDEYTGIPTLYLMSNDLFFNNSLHFYGIKWDFKVFFFLQF